MLSVNLLSRGRSALCGSEDAAAAAVGILPNFSCKDDAFSPQKAAPGDIYPPLHPVCDPQALLLYFTGGPRGSWASGSWPEKGRPAGDVGSQYIRVGSHAVCNRSGRNHPGKEFAVSGFLAGSWERKWRQRSNRRYWRVKFIVSSLFFFYFFLFFHALTQHVGYN